MAASGLSSRHRRAAMPWSSGCSPLATVGMVGEAAAGTGTVMRLAIVRRYGEEVGLATPSACRSTPTSTTSGLRGLSRRSGEARDEGGGAARRRPRRECRQASTGSSPRRVELVEPAMDQGDRHRALADRARYALG